jgi:hypothetical protein
MCSTCLNVQNTRACAHSVCEMYRSLVTIAMKFLESRYMNGCRVLGAVFLFRVYRVYYVYICLLSVV